MVDRKTMLSQYVDNHKQKIELEKKEANLLPTQLNDLECIPMLFEYFCRLKSFDKERSKTLDSDLRKEFIFIILYLYCPKVIVDDKRKMIKGLRKAITQLLGLDAPTGISNIVSGIYVWFTTYKVNQYTTNSSYENIANYLVEKGILKEYLPLCL